MYLSLLPIFFIDLFFSPYPVVSEVVATPEYSQIDKALLEHKGNWVSLDFEIEQGWHTYWINPGQSGSPIRINNDKTIWPYPKIYNKKGHINYGYEGKFSILVNKKNLDETIKINLLACKEICIPQKHEINLNVNYGLGNIKSSKFDDIFSAIKQNQKDIKWFTDNIKPSFLLNDSGAQIDFKTSLELDNIYFYIKKKGLLSLHQSFTKTDFGYRLVVDKGNRFDKSIKELEGVFQASQDNKIINANINIINNE